MARSSSRKKFFIQLYLYSCHRPDAYLILLDRPITYQQYFTLAKLVHHAFIYWQYQKSFIDVANLDNIYSVHLLLDRPPNCTIIGQSSIDFGILKKFLTEFRRLSSVNQHLQEFKRDICVCEDYITFIERLVEHNSHYKSSSLRQIKSIYLKRVQSRRASENRHIQKARYLFSSDKELLDIFFILFREQCQPILYLDLQPCQTTETPTPTNYSLDIDLAMLTETVLDTDMEP